VRSINLSDKSTNCIHKLPEEKNEVKVKPAISEKAIVVCTRYYVVALNKNEGTVLWQFSVDLADSGITIIDNTLFLTEQNRFILLNMEIGKKIKQKKRYRVNWLCESVVEYQKRLFVSTSNSKIIEIDRDTLDIVNEFKFTEKWSVGVSPLFFNNRMYANSYGAYTVCFDLQTNETIWRVKKNSGLNIC
jgi:outer membrane protein assembly factor BamB